MKKKGRPKTKINSQQNRLSVSFTDKAAEILKIIKDGKKSEAISYLLEKYYYQLPVDLIIPSQKPLVISLNLQEDRTLIGDK